MEKRFVSSNHLSTKRDYLGRVNEVDKAQASEKAIKWGKDYWDGSRLTGYGGYKYDGRWLKVAQKIVDEYQLKDHSKILDVGSGKGFLLSDFLKVNKTFDVYGIDISEYAIAHTMEDVKEQCIHGNASKLPWKDDSFDLVISINTIHNLHLEDLINSLNEIQRVSRKYSFICVESYRNEREKMNLMYWQLTCRAFFAPKDWEYIFEISKYKGDHEFIFFE